jgi:transcription antitermination factor NusG
VTHTAELYPLVAFSSVGKKMNCSESLYGKLNFEPRWYALTTRYHHEKTVHARLQQKALTSFLPLHSTCRQWSDRRKQIAEPLFSCYVFVKIALKESLAVLQTDGAIRLVSFNHVPVPIPENQIDAVRRLLAEKISFEKVSDWEIGQHVEVIAGPFKGMQGILQRIKGRSRLVIAVEALRQALAVEVDAALVRPIEREWRVGEGVKG